MSVTQVGDYRGIVAQCDTCGAVSGWLNPEDEGAIRDPWYLEHLTNGRWSIVGGDTLYRGARVGCPGHPVVANG